MVAEDRSVEAIEELNRRVARLRRRVLLPGGALALAVSFATGLAHVSGYLILLRSGEYEVFGSPTVAIAIGVPMVAIVGATWAIYRALLRSLRAKWLGWSRETLGIGDARLRELATILD